jgi:hypothetical protein
MITVKLFSFGNHEEVYDYSQYIDLGKITVAMEKQSYQVSLPYFKQTGINKIPTKDSISIIIYNIIGDKKNIKPNRKSFSSNEAITKKYERTVTTDEGYYQLDMKWYALNREISKGIYYESLINENLKHGIYIYNIPYGTEEIYLTYSIILSSDYEYVLSEKQNAMFKIDWPKCQDIQQKDQNIMKTENRSGLATPRVRIKPRCISVKCKKSPNTSLQKCQHIQNTEKNSIHPETTMLYYMYITILQTPKKGEAE